MSIIVHAVTLHDVLQLEGSKKQKDLLRTRIGDLDLAAAAAEASLSQTRADVAATSERLQGALDKLPDTDEIGQLLLRAAAAYRSLYSAAQAHGLDVPYEALLNNVGGLVWVEELLVSGWAAQLLDVCGGHAAVAAVLCMPCVCSLVLCMPCVCSHAYCASALRSCTGHNQIELVSADMCGGDVHLPGWHCGLDGGR